MADETSTTTTMGVTDPNLDKWERFNRISLEASKSLIEMDNSIKELNSIRTIKLVDDNQSSIINNIAKSIKGSVQSSSELRKVLSGSVEEFKKFAGDHNINIGANLNNTQIENIQNKLIKTFNGFSKESGNSAGEFFSNSFNSVLESVLGKGIANKLESFVGDRLKKINFGSVLESVGVVGAASLNKGLWSLISSKTGLGEVERILLPIQKAALQTGVAFGKSFPDSEANVENFKQSLVMASNTSNRSLNEVSGAANELAENMGTLASTQPITLKQTDSLIDLQRSMGSARDSISATEATLLISNATGIKTSEITSMIGNAYLELGETVGGAVGMFGAIKSAADSSGIGMEKTAKSILDSTNSLKMWGGTVNSVTPLFNMFSASLKGTGREGLTPQLLQKFVSGLDSMSFSARAFLGIRAGGAAGKVGAIGAGLEMEAALEDKTGKGMQKVVSGLMDTLKQYGGGKIITREEAIRDPELQNSFMIQRQLLGQMMNLDTQSANKTLNALSEIQGSGLQVGTEQADSLNNLLASGAKTGENTISEIEKASNILENSLASNAQEVISELKKPFEDLIKITDDMNKSLKSYSSAGGVNKDELKNAVLNFMGQAKEVMGFGGEKSKLEIPKLEVEKSNFNLDISELKLNEIIKQMGDVFSEDKEARSEVNKNIKTSMIPSVKEEIGKNESAIKISESKEQNLQQNIKLLTNVTIDGQKEKVITIRLSTTEMEEIAINALRNNLVSGGNIIG